MKLLKFLHKWVGVIVALFLIILCFSGMMISVARVANLQSPFFMMMRGLHKSLLLDSSGKIIVGIATWLVLFEIISGYILWGKVANAYTKASGKMWKGIVKAWKLNFPSKRFGMHLLLGFCAGIPLLLMAFTGLIFAYDWMAQLLTGFQGEGKEFPFHTLMSLHVGGWLGICSRILWIAATLCGIILAITGLLISFHPNRHRHN